MDSKTGNGWKKYRELYQKKAESIVKTLSLEEKIFLMSGNKGEREVVNAIRGKGDVHYNEKPYPAGGIPEKGIPALAFVDGTRGVVCGRGQATCFPTAVLRGASFDTELEKEVGIAIAEEVVDAGGNLFGGICVNLCYHPGWGRAQEVYGEDTCLLGEMGAALVQGVQKTGVIACIKHFAFNSMENSRFEVNISCSRRAEREVFLPQFKKCIDAGAGAVMSAYNSYGGELCGQNAYLLNRILKEEWRFDGFVISDFNWGIRDTTAAAISGMDIEMPGTCYYGKKLLEAVKRGDVLPERIDEASLRIVRTLLAHQDRIKKNKTKQTKTEEHRKLSLKCARAGITLIRNEKGILPLAKQNAGRKIAVLGRLADRDCTGDISSSRVYPPYVITPFQGIRNMVGEAEVIYYSGDNLSHCRKLAQEADVIIMIVGNSYYDEGEYVSRDQAVPGREYPGGDREQGLGLKKQERDMILAVSSVREDTIVILIGGSMISMSEWHTKVGAILLAYYPGMEGGNAIGEIVFGKVNPSGKLPFVIPEKEEQLPDINWNTKQQAYGYYHGYTLLDRRGQAPLYPFGFGLSYTRFGLRDIKVWAEKERIHASVVVCNTGRMAGAEVIQLYVGMSDSEVDRPHHVLKAFQKIFIRAGKQKKALLSFPIEDLMYYKEECYKEEYHKEESGKFVLERGKYEVYVGTSSALRDLHKVEIFI